MVNAASRKSLKRMPPVKRWLVGHARAFFFSLGQLARNFVNSLLTAAVIGIALALPSALYIGLDNLAQLVGVEQTRTRISVFLEPGSAAGLVGERRLAIAALKEVRTVEWIQASEALESLRSQLGLDESVLIGDNPLPEVLVIEPVEGQNNAERLEALARELRDLPNVEHVSLDLAWVQRLQALARVGGRLALLTAGLLGTGVILVIGNTIRLNIANRRREIEIQQLFGATEGFIRLPFIYSGLILGTLGGLIAATICTAAVLVLQPAVDEFLALYGAGGRLDGLHGPALLLTILGGGMMGALGAAIAVRRHAGELSPRKIT